MSLPTSITTSSKLYVPPELLSHIFSFCTPSSLAAITRTNLACLELASSFLYKSVRLEGKLALERFFGVSGDDLDAGDVLLSEPSPQPHPDRISQYLSLSQIEHFTFLALNIDDELAPLCQRRLPSSLPRLLLPTLTLSLPPTIDFKIVRPPSNTLLSLVSPQTFHLFARHPAATPSNENPSFSPFLDISDLPWDRLQRLYLINSSVFFHHVFTHTRYLSVIPNGFELVLDLGKTWEPWRDEIAQSLLDGACNALNEARDVGLWAKVLVVVDTEETKVWFREDMMVGFADPYSGATFARLDENLDVELGKEGVQGTYREVKYLTLTGMAL